MSPHFFKLKNGMRVHTVPVSGTEATTVLVLTKVGSRYEFPEISGVSHYIEHLMFKGTKKHPTTLDISRLLDAIGAEYNAFTGKESTGYYVKAEKSHVKLAIDLLHDMLAHSVFDAVEMDRERSVIMEEINMYHDNPLMRVEELLEEAMYPNHTLGWNIAGSHETMKTMTRDAVLKYRYQFYIPSRMVVVVAGNIPAETKDWLEHTFGTMKDEGEAPHAFMPFVHPTTIGMSFKIQKQETSQIQVMCGFHGFGVKDKRNAACRILSLILGETMSSRLFVAIREKRGLAYMVRSSYGNYEDIGAFTIQMGLDPSRLDQAISALHGELEKIKKEGVTAEELREAKDHVRGKTLLRMEDSSDRASWYANQELMLDEVKTIDERMAEYEAVTKVQVQDMAQELLKWNQSTWAAIGPYENEQAFQLKAGL